MTTPQRNSLLVFAIVAGLLSLPMSWFTTTTLQPSFRRAGVDPPSISQSLVRLPPVTGVSGSVVFFLETPLWFVVAVSITASVMQLMTLSLAFEIPRSIAWITPLVGIIGTILPIFPSDSSGQTSIHLGWLLAIFCACAPLACLVLTRIPSSTAPPPKPRGSDIELPNAL